MLCICDKNGIRLSESDFRLVEKEKPFTGWNGETGTQKSKLVYTGDKNELLGELIFGDLYFVNDIRRPDGSIPNWHIERIKIPEEGLTRWLFNSFFVEVVYDDGFKCLRYACQKDDPNLQSHLLGLRSKSIDFEEVRYPIRPSDNHQQYKKWHLYGKRDETENDFIRYVCADMRSGGAIIRNLKWPIDEYLLPAEPW